MVRRKQTILVLLGYYEHDIYRGMLAFSAKHNLLIYRPLLWDENELSQAIKQCDGVLSLHAGNPHIIKLLKETDRPIVDIGKDIGLNCYRAYTDDIEIGRMGASHFIDKGFQNMAFVNTGTVPHHEDNRAKGFNNEALRAEKNIRKINFKSYDEVHAKLPQILVDLPKPFALMATSDLHANTIIEKCMDLDIKVPGEIAVLGVTSEKIYGESTPIPISCVETNCFELGYTAARILNELMQNREVNSKLTFTKPSGIYERQSTNIMAIKHQEVIKAIAYIKEYFKEPINVEDIVNQVSISHRQLNKLFKKYLGQTIAKELTRHRLELACQLLKNSDLKVKDIARQAGFSTSFRMNIVFNREMGLSPREFRKNHPLR